MLGFDAILVAVDFSPASLGAVRRAVALAGDACLRLLHVIDTEMLPRSTKFDSDLADDVLAALIGESDRAVKELARELEAEGAKVATEVRHGRPADEIVSAAHAAGLLVLGAHGRSAVAELVMGSVAEEVVRRSPAPVLVVREGGEGEARVGRVLLALDVGEPSLEAIDSARELAAHSKAPLEVVHVVRAPSLLPRGDAVERIRSAAEKDARELLARTLGAATPLQVRTGSPAEEIACAATPDDVVVCGTHARSTLGRIVYGAVAAEVARRAPCPVLIARRLGP